MKTISKDFSMDSLQGESLKIANAILNILPVDASGGGCRAFYSPKEWKERKEDYGLNSVLIVVHDGGDLAKYCNPDYESYSDCENLNKALEKIGYYLEGCTCWYSAVYKV